MIAVTPEGGVRVRTVAVEPDSKMISTSPDAGSVTDRVDTSPHLYVMPLFAVMLGVVPETVTGAWSMVEILDLASSVYVPTALELED